VEATVLEYDSDHVEVLRKLGLKVFYGDASRHDLLRAAGADQARLIILSIDDHERSLGLVHTVRKHFPHLTILARANGRPEAYELLDAGVLATVEEELQALAPERQARDADDLHDLLRRLGDLAEAQAQARCAGPHLEWLQTLQFERRRRSADTCRIGRYCLAFRSRALRRTDQGWLRAARRPA